MKRCPECTRDYYDDSLLYCLDDGTALLEGPASADEPATFILPETAAPGEAATRAQIQITDAAPQPGSHVGLEKRILFANKAAKPLAAFIAIVLVSISGFLAYRYFGSSTGQIDS